MSVPPEQWPSTIREINDLPDERKRAIYQTLIPDWVFPMFQMDVTGPVLDNSALVRFRCPHGSAAVEISIYHQPDARDPVLYLHMSDTFMSQLAVLLVIVNDPASPRFNIDVDEMGLPTQLGTLRRNLVEEQRALEAGLAPGQIRRGLRIFRTAVPLFDTFVQHMGHELYFIEPLFYHNAITFERYGFAYSRGGNKMRTIHREFQPGGQLYARLDGSSVFRSSDAWQTVTGRSWAIHDGILDESLDGIQMYRQIGRDAGVNTFPDALW